MKKAQMIFYTTSVIGFYAALILLYGNLTSVIGLSILSVSIVTLALGFFCQWRAAYRMNSWSCTSVETASASC